MRRISRDHRVLMGTEFSRESCDQIKASGRAYQSASNHATQGSIAAPLERTYADANCVEKKGYCGEEYFAGMGAQFDASGRG